MKSKGILGRNKVSWLYPEPYGLMHSNIGSRCSGGCKRQENRASAFDTVSKSAFTVMSVNALIQASLEQKIGLQYELK